MHAASPRNPRIPHGTLHAACVASLHGRQAMVNRADLGLLPPLLLLLPPLGQAPGVDHASFLQARSWVLAPRHADLVITSQRPLLSWGTPF